MLYRGERLKEVVGASATLRSSRSGASQETGQQGKCEDEERCAICVFVWGWHSYL